MLWMLVRSSSTRRSPQCCVSSMSAATLRSGRRSSAHAATLAAEAEARAEEGEDEYWDAHEVTYNVSYGGAAITVSYGLQGARILHAGWLVTHQQTRRPW